MSAKKKSFKNSPAMQFLSVTNQVDDALDTPAGKEDAPSDAPATKTTADEIMPLDGSVDSTDAPIQNQPANPIGLPNVPAAEQKTPLSTSEADTPAASAKLSSEGAGEPKAQKQEPDMPSDVPAPVIASSSHGAEALDVAPASPVFSRPKPVGESGIPLKPNPAYIETRSKRVQLLMQPSLHSRLKEEATKSEVSLNDLVHNVLETWLGTRR